MEKSIRALLQRYRETVETGSAPDPLWVNHYNDLRLVDASLDKVHLNERTPDHPQQISILGPTQSGKSTLVNLLTDTQCAGVSAKAGYTVHTQGFAVDVDHAAMESVSSVLDPMRRVPASDLATADLNSYVLEPVQAGSNAIVEDAVVWDSPDFDSIEARGYRGAVLYALALADVLVLMVSKDKYGDKSVWDMLSLMVPLGKPLLVVINKLNPTDTKAVTRSFTDRFNKRFGQSAAPEVLTLPYLPENTTFDVASIKAIKDGVQAARLNSDRSRMKPAITQVVANNWARWVAPAEHEHNASERWLHAVDDSILDALNQYEARFLNDDSRNDTFNRAVAELLTLLEIPGLAATLQKTRELVTWPARKLFGVGVQRVRGDSAKVSAIDLEKDVLMSALTRQLTHLQGIAIDAQSDFPDQSAWWGALHTELRGRKDSLSDDFERASARYRENFEPRIEAAAQRLYGKLKTQPRLLNSLRAARVTTDAAAVALAVKSGGLAASDLIIAPAMLSVTTLLTESALGRYMATVRGELKNEQHIEVKEQVFEAVLGASLRAMPNTMDQTDLLGMEGLSLEAPV